MFRLGLFKIRAFTVGNLAGLLVSIARGGIQFMLIIWLQGIWLPLHGYSYDADPAVGGHLPAADDRRVPGVRADVGDPVATSSGRAGSRPPAWRCSRVSFVGLMLLPVNFPYWAFALLIALNGIGQRHVRLAELLLDHGQRPAPDRGAASGMRATFQNSGTAVSIGVVFTLMIAGLSRSLPSTLSDGLIAAGRARQRRAPGRDACRRCRRCSPRCSA